MKRLLIILVLSFICAAPIGFVAEQGMQILPSVLKHSKTGRGFLPIAPLLKMEPGDTAPKLIPAAIVIPKTAGLPLFYAGRAGFLRSDLFLDVETAHRKTSSGIFHLWAFCQRGRPDHRR